MHYNEGDKLAICATCEVGNDVLEAIQFFCTWKLHQPPRTVSYSWNPLVNPGDAERESGYAEKTEATGEWFGGVEIKYQSGTEILTITAKSVRFVPGGGGGGGGGVVPIDDGYKTFVV